MRKATSPVTLEVQETGATTSDSKQRKTRVLQADVPRHSLQEALRVSHALNDSYAKRPTKPLNVAIALELTPASTQFKMLLGASSAYGLTEGSWDSEVIALTDLGRRIVAPTTEDMARKAMREALLRPRVVKEFLTRYNNAKIPTDKIAQNVLEEIGVPADSTGQTLELILKGAREVGVLTEHKGNIYVDLDTEVSTENSEDDAVDRASEAHRKSDVPPREIPKEEDSKEKVLIPPHQNSEASNRVFITHGRNTEIVTQLKELLHFGNFVPVIAAEHETVSKPVPDKVMDDMRSCYAAIIHVGKEIKLLDQEGKEHVFLNQNVLIEIGAAMALYKRRFILLVEHGATLPSNLQGLYEVRYEGDKLNYDATMKLLKAFNEFKS